MNCRTLFARVCSYEDFYYLFSKTGLDATYDPNGPWLGDFVDDDIVLCGSRAVTVDNDPDILNFEAPCLKTGIRAYYCCHDRE